MHVFNCSPTRWKRMSGRLMPPLGWLLQNHAIHPGKYWLDITDLLNPSEWKTMNDSEALVYSNCASISHTNEDNTKNCVYMSLENDFEWAIASCSEKMNFVCYHA
ncbi:hypothetical protein MAR_000148, partial [Mya arenaria]